MQDLILPDYGLDEAKLILAGEYDVPLREHPSLALDIGANVGVFSAWAAQVWPAAHIIAFEPHPDNADKLRTNTAQFANVIPREFGIRAKAGKETLHVADRAMCHGFDAATVRRLGANTGGTVEVDCIAAGDLPRAEFIKIDTEGCEVEIIENLDLSHTQALVCEAHSYGDGARITDYLTARGFCVHDRKRYDTGCLLLKFARRAALSNRQKLMVAVPYYGAAPSSFIECLIQLSHNPPCNMSIKHIAGDSLVSRARNTLTADFLSSDCTDLLFIDSDLIFWPWQVKRLVSHDVDVCAGFYPKKQDGPLRWVCNAHTDPPTKPCPDQLQDVRYMGTGFMRVRRNVFEAMIARYGEEILYGPDHSPDKREHDLWPVGVYIYPDGRRRYLSEDWYFCQRWLDMGGKVWADTGIVLHHIGTAAYPLESQRPQITNPDSYGKPV